MPCNIPVVILSDGRSLFKNTLFLPVENVEGYSFD